VPYWWVDAGASMMLVLLAAVDEGLAAGFLGSHRTPELKDLLGIPSDVEPIGIITLGHPAPDRRSGSIQRGRRSDNVHREHWDT
jgi:nitroreductase